MREQDGARVRPAVALALATARLDLARDEDERRRIQSELDLMLSSKGRLGLMNVRRRMMLVAGSVVRPWRGIQAVAVLFSRATSGYASVFAAFRALRHQSISLRHEPLDVASSHPDPGATVRWVGPVTIAGRTKHALDCPPDSAATLRVHGAAGASLAVHVALPPSAWLADDTGVTFTVDVCPVEERDKSGTRAGRGQPPHPPLRPLRRSALAEVAPGDP
ncbi:MAG: hypothetical protein Q7V01_02210 [Vicinamibacterales bacterium]|nr:hypothetical protein [Vicinamibacterales bacterium]